MALFGDNDSPSSTQSNLSSPGQVNMVGQGTAVEGTLHAENDIRVSGRVIGKLRVDGKAMIAQEGMIEGELKAQNADIAGSIQGEIEVEEQLVLKSSARVDGNIQTERLVVEEGAIFTGECQMGEASRARSESPQNAEEPASPEALSSSDESATADESAPSRTTSAE